MGIVNMVAGTTKPVILPHGTAHMTPASRMIHSLALGAVHSLLGGRRRLRAGKKKVPRGLRKKARRARSVLAKRGLRASRRRKPTSHRRSGSVLRHRSRGGRLVKGSRAAKLHMARIRRMRGTKAAA